MTRAQSFTAAARATQAQNIMLRLEKRGLAGLVRGLARQHFASLDEVCGRSREARIVRARHAVWRALHQDPGFPAIGVARLFNVDHTSVLYALGTLTKCRAMGRAA